MKILTSIGNIFFFIPTGLCLQFMGKRALENSFWFPLSSAYFTGKETGVWEVSFWFFLYWACTVSQIILFYSQKLSYLGAFFVSVSFFSALYRKFWILNQQLDQAFHRAFLWSKNIFGLQLSYISYIPIQLEVIGWKIKKSITKKEN